MTRQQRSRVKRQGRLSFVPVWGSAEQVVEPLAGEPEEDLLVEDLVPLGRRQPDSPSACCDPSAGRSPAATGTILSVKSSLEGAQAYGSLRHDIASRTIHTLPGLHRPAAVILERLARTRSGEAAIDRLLELFEISGTLLETPVLTHLRDTVMQREAD